MKHYMRNIILYEHNPYDEFIMKKFTAFNFLYWKCLVFCNFYDP